MAELTEQQLLLLNSLVYLDCSYPSGTTVETLVSSIRNTGLDKINYGGGMSEQDVNDLLNAIEADESLKNLIIVDSVDTEIRGICFADPDGDAVIAYRGTGGAYAAWDDNCQGGYLSDTDMQKEALAFAEKCAKDYDNITVTGHSKGGNMAQYITVLMGDKVDRCVSFDGQGFGDEFLEKYADEIAANKSKIRSVCAYNDYVNILLTPIAGEIVYLDNDEFVFPGGHYVFELYKNENNKMNENGEYVNSEIQGIYKTWQKKAIDQIKRKLEEFVEKMDAVGNYSPYTEFAIYSLVGMLLGMGLGEDRSLEKLFEVLSGNIEDFIEEYFPSYFSGKRDLSCCVTVDTEAMRECSGAMSSAAAELETLRARIQTLQKRMATNIIDGIAIGLPLQTVLLRLDSESSNLSKLATALNNCAGQYESAEAEARGLAG